MFLNKVQIFLQQIGTWFKTWNAAKIRKTILVFLIVSFLIPIHLIVFVYAGAFGKIPSRTELQKIQNPIASEVYSADNYLLGRYYLENRSNAELKDVPLFLINALIATEDIRFYKHHGIDFRSTLRVMFKSILLFNKNSGGGSTLTQQLAKNVYPRGSFGILTMPVVKIKEIITAHRLEQVYSKDEILTLYLNTVCFGENAYGIETAALIYFNKKTSDLLPDESAMMVGLLKANTGYNPRLNPEAATKRRNLVLQQMVKYKYIGSKEALKWKAQPIKLQYRTIRHDEGPAPYFREELRQVLLQWAKENPKPDGSNFNIYTDGLKIYSSIDYRLQTYAEMAMQAHMQQLQKEFDQHWKGKEPWKKDPKLAWNEISQSKRAKDLIAKGLSQKEIISNLKTPVNSKIFTWEGEKAVNISPLDSILHHFALLQAGILSMECKSGWVKAWVGGINNKYFKLDHVKTHRQAGSTFKPFVYASALEHGVTPCQFFANDSVVYTDYDNWIPRNSDRDYGGFYSVKGALTHSVNTISVKLLMETGFDEVIDLARNLGFEGDLQPVPSLALGTGSVSLLELVSAYSIFVNEGYEVKPQFINRIEDATGNILFTSEVKISEEPFISEKTAQEITAMLENAVNQGTGNALRSTYGFTSDLAGKTGTTQSQTDGWFIGISPDLITGVWVGGDNPVVRFRSIRYGQGAHMALPIFAQYMQQVYSDPVFAATAHSVFTIREEVRAEMDCEDYREEEFNSLQEFLQKREEGIGDFIRRVFGRNKAKDESNE